MPKMSRYEKVIKERRRIMADITEKEEKTSTEEKTTKNEDKPKEQTIDYEKIQQMIVDTLASKKEDTAQNQQTNVTQNTDTVQTQISQMQEVLQKTQIENVAILEAVELGIDAKTIPYILKMSDFSSVMDSKGNINKDTIKTMLNKVIEDVPGLKTQVKQQSNGFVKVGAEGNSQQNFQEEQLATIFGNKK